MEAVAQAEGAPPPRTLGQTLSAERERQGLSRADVAQRLHMSAYQVEALENGDYTRLPQGTFLRGFVRNYTKVLGLNADAALNALSAVAPSGPAPGIVVPTQNIRFDPLGERFSNPHFKAWSFAAVTLALVLAAGAPAQPRSSVPVRRTTWSGMPWPFSVWSSGQSDSAQCWNARSTWRRANSAVRG